ncbi:hypothetical protein niasHT_034112 [Heterodera trifolii]|uniref:Uncharacterized protein n=1 Tax=Heterodera trifolii TaxID=157864 RepID=A0ABD2J1A6_9BILA
MLVLQELDPPTEAVIETEGQVVAHWESHCLGQGTLYLIESHGTKNGFRLPIPSIVVHAASGASEDFSEPCLFLMVDYSKTDIEYVPAEVDDIDEETEEDTEVKTVAVRLAPTNAMRKKQLKDGRSLSSYEIKNVSSLELAKFPFTIALKHPI